MRPRGRWAKWYASVVTDKAAYTDAEFRAFAILVALGADCAGEWKSRAHLVGLLDRFVEGSTGAELVGTLIERGDLRVRRGGRIEAVGWEVYQGPKPDPTAADRQRRHRERVAAEASARHDDLVTVRDDTPPITPIPEHDRHTVTHRDTLTLSLSSTSPGHGEVQEGALDVAGYAPLAKAIDDLTGRPYSLRNPWSGLAEMARHLAQDFGLERTLEAFRRAAATTEHPDARAIIFGANGALRRVRNPGAIERDERVDEEQRRRAAAVERTRREAEERAAWIAEDGASQPPAARYDAPRRIGDMIVRPAPQVRNGGTP